MAMPPAQPRGELDLGRLARLGGSGAVLYLCYRVVAPLAVALLFAAGLATLTRRPSAALARRLRGRRRIAAALTVLVLFLAVLAPLGALGGFVVQRLVREATELARGLSLEGGAPGVVTQLADRAGPLGPALRRLADDVGPRLAEALPAATQRAARAIAFVGSAVVQIGLGLFLLAVTLYYLIVDGPAWRERIVRLAPLRASETRLFLHRFHQVSVGVLLGNLGTAFTQGTLATVGYLSFGAPLPFFWGFMTLIAALMPLVGTTLVWVPLSLVLGLTSGWLRGLGLFAFGLLVVSTVDNLVRPFLTGRGLPLHPLALFIAVFGGVAAFGLPGLFLGPLTVALALTALELYEERTA